MQTNTERFSKGTQRKLTGLYIPTYNTSGFEPIIPSEEPLTVDNFGIIMDGNTYTADDFQWYYEDGTDRDLKYDDSNCCVYGNDLPNEVFCLLNTKLCIEFATRQLAYAKAALEDTDNDDAKQTINKEFIEFENATESDKKLQIACDALKEASDVFEDVDDDFYNTFYDASDVISEVISELAEKSGKS